MDDLPPENARESGDRDPVAVAQRLIAVCDQWLDGVSDPSEGALGQKLRRDFAAAACPEEIDSYSDNLAVYSQSMEYDSLRDSISTEKKIIYGSRAASDFVALFSFRIHEMIHALQYENVPELHAFFEKSAIICPEDYVFLREAIERDAYAKQALFLHLAKKEHPEIEDHQEKYGNYLYTASVFIHADEKDYPEALRYVMARHAATIMGLHGRDGDNSDARETLRDIYHRDALRSYANIYNFMLRGMKGVSFVRIDRERALHAIGRSFGIDPFSEEKSGTGFLGPLALSPENWEILEKINEALGIKDRNDLPTFEEALKARNLTEAAFLDLALNRSKGPAPL